MRKCRQFIWGKEQQLAFEEIKCRLIKPPVLHLSDNKGRFHLYSDTSKFATGSAFYQIQNGKLKLIAYTSKRLPEAAQNYSITELEMCGLAINFASFTHLLIKVDFNATMDHLALTHIIKSKGRTSCNENKKAIRAFKFYLYYTNLTYTILKEKIWYLAISMQEHDDGNLHKIILVSFNMQGLLQARYYNISGENSEMYLVQTQSQTKSGGIKLPEVHGIGKSLNLNIEPERQVVKPIVVTKAKEVSQIKPRSGQGKAWLRHKIKSLISKPLTQIMEKPSSKILLPDTSNIQDMAISISNYTSPQEKTQKDNTGCRSGNSHLSRSSL